MRPQPSPRVLLSKALGAPLALIGIAALSTGALAGLALARSFSVSIAKDGQVTNSGTHFTKREAIVVGGRGFAVYDLSGETKQHPKCTKRAGCFAFWPPLTVSSAKKLAKSPGVKGKLGIWKRDGFMQVTLAGHPLYTFAADTHKHHATGEGVRSFGGTWHVVSAGSTGGGGGGSSKPSSPSGTTTTGSGTTPSNPYQYPMAY